MTKAVYWIWFAELFSLEPNVKNYLLESFGDAESIFKCTDYSKFSYLSIKDKTVLMNKKLESAEKIINSSNNLGINIITFDSPLYPPSLREIYNPPYVLYIKGIIPDWQENLFIGMVGTRRCSEYGVAAVRHFCREFAEYGVITVSGLARGIDTEVATATIANGGKTLAVLGCGLDICYPSENSEIMQKVEQCGLLISEFPPGTPPLPHHFPIRNRIISGISNGLMVVESPKKGGSLISADHALEQGKEVFSVPGSIFQKNSEGTNKLISNGQAKAVLSCEDVLSEFSYTFTKRKPIPAIVPVSKPAETETHIEAFDSLSEDEKTVAQLLLSGPMHADEIMRTANLPAAQITTIFSMLEFSGIIERQSGNIYKLKV